MSISELNPNHPVTQAIREHWVKLCAIIVAKAGGHVVITLDDITAFSMTDAVIAVQELKDGIHLRLVTAEEGERLARQQGGRPN